MSRRKNLSAAYGVPNRNTGNNNTRRRRRRKKKGKKRSVGNANVRALARVISHRINPFTRNRTSLIFDHNRTPIVPIHAARTFTITSDANGHAAFVVSPSWAESFFWSPTIDATNNITALGSGSTGTLYSSSSYSKIRLVSCGLRIRSIASPTDSSGLVRIFVDPSTYDEPSATYDLTQAQLHATAKQVPLFGCDETVLLHPTSIEQYEFQDVTTNAHDFKGWENMLISVDGVPASTSVLTCEVVHNYECMVPPEGTLHHHTQRPADHNSLIEDIYNGARVLVDNVIHGDPTAHIENAALGAAAATTIPSFMGAISSAGGAVLDAASGVLGGAEAVGGGLVGAIEGAAPLLLTL